MVNRSLLGFGSTSTSSPFGGGGGTGTTGFGSSTSGGFGSGGGTFQPSRQLNDAAPRVSSAVIGSEGLDVFGPGQAQRVDSAETPQ